MRFRSSATGSHDAKGNRVTETLTETIHIRSVDQSVARAFRILAASRGVRHAELLAQLVKEAQ